MNSRPFSVLRVMARTFPNNVRMMSKKPPDTPHRDKLDLSFNDPVSAFKSKQTSELVRAYLVYQICSVNWIVENNDKIMKRLRQVIGERLFEIIMKATFYGQFVAGEDLVKIQPVVDRMTSFGVKSILDYSVEEDLTGDDAKKNLLTATTPSAKPEKEATAAVGEDLKQFKIDKQFADRRFKVKSARTFFYVNEEACEKNVGHFLKSIEAVHKATKSTGLMAVKLTALGRPQLLLQLSEVIMQARNYMKKLDGKAGNVLAHHKTIEDFKRYFGEKSSDPQVQKFMENMTADKKGIVHLFPWSHILDENANLSESFRLPDPKTGQMRRLISQISPDEEKMFYNMLKRLNHIIKVAGKVDVRIMVDAEQTYFQPAISRICVEMMRKYNKTKPMVLNTYQTYLKNTYTEMVYDLEQAERQNFYWGAKLVRGAYIEQERARATAMGYEDPTCANMDATTASYHKCLKEVLNRISGVQKGRLGVMVASHNEDTVRYAIQLMKEHKVKPEEKVVCFGQLLGMCDHVTFPLGQAGYSAYKYVPYGPVLEVLPYLSRRANENRGFLAKIKKEKGLLRREIFRRIIKLQMFHKPVGNFKPV